MRIIAGSAHGLKLRVPRGKDVRPTGARVRASLFSILGPVLEGARVADLFAGCGALGIEALSRGAAHCCFVESSRAALAALEDNLARSRLADRAEILRQDAFAAAHELEARRPFDVVLLDPPYLLLRQDMQRCLALLEGLAAGPALAAEALIVLQHDGRTALPSPIGPLVATDVRRYGITSLTFLEPRRDAAPPDAG